MIPAAVAVPVAISMGLAFFVAMWLVVGGILSRLSGWSALAERFPAVDTPTGQTLGGQVVGMGPINENNVTYLTVSPSGLHLAAMFLFRFSRPAILVPWPYVRYVAEHKLFWLRTHELDLAGVTSLRIKAKALEAIGPFLNPPRLYSAANDRRTS